MTKPLRRFRLTHDGKEEHPELAGLAFEGVEVLEPRTTAGIVCVAWTLSWPDEPEGRLTTWMRETDLVEVVVDPVPASATSGGAG